MSREIDKKVAERVMSWEREIGPLIERVWFNNGKGGAIPLEEWNPSTNISDAWQLVGNMKEKGFYCCLKHVIEHPKAQRPEHVDMGDYHCILLKPLGNGEYQSYDFYSKSAPMAICIASLKAVGGDIDE